MEKKLKMLEVMPMKKKKNLIFILPIFCSGNGVTIVIILLIVLKQDIMKQCRKLKIGVGMWNNKKLLDEVQIMLVMLEDALMDGFNSFLN